MQKHTQSVAAMAASAAVLLLYLITESHAQSTANAAETVPLYEDLGSYHVEITTSQPLAQRYFDQGMRLYYAFNHQEAIRAFRAAQRLDSNCAMCWWGEALSWGPNINLPMDTPSAIEAYRAVQGAVERKPFATQRERALIDALEQRYTEDAPAQRAGLDQAYADAMAEVVADFPEDLDVAVLYAESLMDLRPWDYWNAAKQPQPGIAAALTQLERVMAALESHPGACHFYIHAVEAVYPERAVPCAERLAKLMPGAGHLVHMPGHIYIRVGRYLDAVEANEHAVHADESYIQDQHPGMGMYTAGYYPHNYDFMAFAAMMIGRSQMAIESAERVTALLPDEMFGSPGMDFLQHWLMRPQQMNVRFARWDSILETPQPTAKYPHGLALWHYAQGRALIAKGRLDEADQRLAGLRTILAGDAIEGLRMEFNQSRDLLAIAERVLSGWRAAAEGDFDTAISALERAVQLESALLYGEPPEWSVPTRQELGAVLLRAGHAERAEEVFGQDLALFPQNGWSLWGTVRALEEQGRHGEADEFRAEFERVWASADVDIAASF